MKKRCILLIFLLVLTLPGCTPELPGTTAAKPVIYLYPRRLFRLPGGKIEAGEIADLTVLDLNWPHAIDSTLFFSRGRSTPFDGWTVTAAPDGTLTDREGRAYYCLFWEGISSQNWDFSQGFCVRGANTAAFLEEALSQLGLTDREANEFLIYWLPKLEGNAWNLLSFQGTAYTDHARLTMSPQPDTVLRVFLAWKALEEPVDVEPQILTAPDRQGFTLVEWGGCQVF